MERTLPGEPSWTVEDAIKFSGLLADHGVDLIDVSSGGNSAQARMSFFSGPGYQVPFAEAVKKAHGNKVLVSAIGMLHTSALAQIVLDKGKADIVFIGRLFQEEPGCHMDVRR